MAANSPVYLLFRDPFVYALDEYIFIMRAVEYLDHPFSGHLFVHSPEKVMIQILLQWVF